MLDGRSDAKLFQLVLMPFSKGKKWFRLMLKPKQIFTNSLLLLTFCVLAAPLQVRQDYDKRPVTLMTRITTFVLDLWVSFNIDENATQNH